MSDQTALGLSTKRGRAQDLVIDREDGRILEELAGRVAELARRTQEREKRNLWYLHNDLKGERPLIFCDPENGWNEIIPQKTLQCSGKLAREWEMTLRKEIFWGESMGDDRVIEPVFTIPYVYEDTGYGLSMEKIGGEEGGSYTWEAPLKDYHKDLEKLHFPEITVDDRCTEELRELAQTIFGHLLKVQVKGLWWWTLGLTWNLIDLRGLEQFMMDMYDYPEELHKLMAFLRDAHLYKLDFLEEEGLLSLNNDGTYVGSGGFGYTEDLPQEDFEGRVRTRDMWGFGESQETISVSPQMFKEFVFPYQLPILKRFGLNCYGCCEPLDRRWDMIKTIPNLRRVSVSPWSDVKDMAEKLEDHYILSLKPHPGDLAVPHLDEKRVREKIQEDLHITRGCHVEVIMKDNHTIRNNPQNVITWCKIAQEEVHKIAT